MRLTDVLLLSARRTPIGRPCGQFRALPVEQLGAAGLGEKIAIKTTFETPPEEDAGGEIETQRDRELKIRPYRPLRFRSP